MEIKKIIKPYLHENNDFTFSMSSIWKFVKCIWQTINAKLNTLPMSFYKITICVPSVQIYQ